MKERLFSRNFAALILGQGASLFGNFILKFALSMYILEITGSAAIFASVLAFATIPAILLSPLGGILADRANKRNVMVFLDLFTGLLILLSILFLTPQNAVMVIGILLVLLSVLSAFESPTVQACLPEMLHGDNLVKGNAVVNQINAVAGIVAPIFGGFLYTVIGIDLLMIISVGCFLLTAAFECFIRLDHQKSTRKEAITKIIKNDFIESVSFIRKETNILKMLLLYAVLSFFTVGIALVGLPFIVRNILGMGANMYGIAESLVGLSAIIGGVTAGVLATKIKLYKLWKFFLLCGVGLLISGITFLFSTNPSVIFAGVVFGLCILQFSVCLLSIFAISFIQQSTPNRLIGKVMSYAMAITMCLQPLSQALYGVLFDRFQQVVYTVIIPSAFILFLIGVLSIPFFNRLKKEA